MRRRPLAHPQGVPTLEAGSRRGTLAFIHVISGRWNTRGIEQVQLLSSTEADIKHAGQILANGGLVAFPTETVYGLGADALNRQAVSRVFAVKGRPHDHPLILHVASADRIVDWVDAVPDEAVALASRFWPGPLTLILRRGRATPDWVTGGQDTVGVRVPGHPVALALIEASGTAIAAPSANRFGRISPTCAAHVVDDLGDDVDCVIDGGPCAVGLESTILDLTGAEPRILRPGAISADDISRVLGAALSARATTAAPRVPGSLASHYAPRTPLRLLQWADIAGAVESADAAAVLSFADLPPGCRPRWAVRMPADPAAYGRDLYSRLREADASGCELILVETPPAEPLWWAVRDRLERAAG